MITSSSPPRRDQETVSAEHERQPRLNESVSSYNAFKQLADGSSTQWNKTLGTESSLISSFLEKKQFLGADAQGRLVAYTDPWK